MAIADRVFAHFDSYFLLPEPHSPLPELQPTVYTVLLNYKQLLIFNLVSDERALLYIYLSCLDGNIHNKHIVGFWLEGKQDLPSSGPPARVSK